MNRDDTYTPVTDACDGYRCLMGSDVTPQCYATSNCDAGCRGDCVSVASWKSLCRNAVPEPVPEPIPQKTVPLEPLPEIKEPAEPTCVDSDGEDLYSQGFTLYTESSGEEHRIYDSCDGDHIHERLCLEDTPEYNDYRRTICPMGCRDGACIR
ncbi:hypothetical protein GOV07_05455 [Candidatus Woesearchaeota archaeon]|nr:hypothetical protein [Candidatus Woesearchaeota archaeon]